MSCVRSKENIREKKSKNDGGEIDGRVFAFDPPQPLGGVVVLEILGHVPVCEILKIDAIGGTHTPHPARRPSTKGHESSLNVGENMDGVRGSFDYYT